VVLNTFGHCGDGVVVGAIVVVVAIGVTMVVPVPGTALVVAVVVVFMGSGHKTSLLNFISTNPGCCFLMKFMMTFSLRVEPFFRVLFLFGFMVKTRLSFVFTEYPLTLTLLIDLSKTSWIFQFVSVFVAVYSKLALI